MAVGGYFCVTGVVKAGKVYGTGSPGRSGDAGLRLMKRSVSCK